MIPEEIHIGKISIKNSTQITRHYISLFKIVGFFYYDMLFQCKSNFFNNLLPLKIKSKNSLHSYKDICAAKTRAEEKS